MSASGSETFDTRPALAIGQPIAADETSAFHAWGDAVRGASSVLMEASRLTGDDPEVSPDSRLGALLAGLRDLEARLRSEGVSSQLR
jgi:hypothetical protein